jgi:arginine repressor
LTVGQATLSRDIHELKLVKGPDGYRRAGENPGPKAWCRR